MAVGEMTSEEFTEFLVRIFGLLASYSVDGALQYIYMDWRHLIELLRAGGRIYSELKNICVWVKDNAGMGSLYRSQHEFVFVYKQGNAAHRNNVELVGRYRSNVWMYPGVNSFSRNSEEGNLLENIRPLSQLA
jgi:hypothetical protein